MDRRGFTLVELLVVLAVGSILLAIAVPGYGYLLSAGRLTTLTNDLVAALHLARSEAIKRGTRVTLCKTGSAAAASPSCDSTPDWQQGWLVFVDGGTRGVIDTGDELLWVRGPASGQASITTSNYANFISYLPNGKSQGMNNLANGYFHICVAGNRRDIIVNTTGRPRLASSTC